MHVAAGSRPRAAGSGIALDTDVEVVDLASLDDDDEEEEDAPTAPQPPVADDASARRQGGKAKLPPPLDPPGGVEKKLRTAPPAPGPQGGGGALAAAGPGVKVELRGSQAGSVPGPAGLAAVDMVPATQMEWEEPNLHEEDGGLDLRDPDPQQEGAENAMHGTGPTCHDQSRSARVLSHVAGTAATVAAAGVGLHAGGDPMAVEAAGVAGGGGVDGDDAYGGEVGVGAGAYADALPGPQPWAGGAAGPAPPAAHHMGSMMLLQAKELLDELRADADAAGGSAEGSAGGFPLTLDVYGLFHTLDGDVAVIEDGSGVMQSAQLADATVAPLLAGLPPPADLGIHMPHGLEEIQALYDSMDPAVREYGQDLADHVMQQIRDFSGLIRLQYDGPYVDLPVIVHLTNEGGGPGKEGGGENGSGAAGGSAPMEDGLGSCARSDGEGGGQEGSCAMYERYLQDLGIVQRDDGMQG
ncbi:hypothetical protein GPECTOR_14g93 [Gonium pectorale]|uniref:Uncharacterized protein n=1 Tax=Gonium pectorale TaxID=33097 RepID=A0A150GN03_GONPE|nr:hypothetical protein GPECTOR_14g93 [Gonium pectorale]|eukprot:KXZ51112.1 hypothetical protein GPECTOR_14g93 [Gonium pectorale]